MFLRNTYQGQVPFNTTAAAVGIFDCQRQSYDHMLRNTHHQLSRLYRRLQDIEYKLSQRQELRLSRKDKKNLQWQRAKLKQQVRELEATQSSLHEVMAVYNPRPLPLLWVNCYTPPTPSYPFTPSPYSHMPTPPLWSSFTMNLPITDHRGQDDWEPLHSQFPARASECTSTADSGYCEPPMHALPFELQEEVLDENHVFSHEIYNSLDAAAPEFVPSEGPSQEATPETLTNGRSAPCLSLSVGRRFSADVSQHLSKTVGSVDTAWRSHRRVKSIPITPTSSASATMDSLDRHLYR